MQDNDDFEEEEEEEEAREGRSVVFIQDNENSTQNFACETSFFFLFFRLACRVPSTHTHPRCSRRANINYYNTCLRASIYIYIFESTDTTGERKRRYIIL